MAEEKASTDMAHHAALAPNSPDGIRPPSLFRTRGPPDQLICRYATTPKTLYQPLLELHRGERKLHRPSIPGRGCSINRFYSGLFLECPIQLGTKFTSAHC